VTVTRSLAVSLLLAVGACASNPQGGQAPRPAPGEDGPGATISATYTGGIIAREVTASFNVSEAAFVVVGHLGGDGMLRVLYPSAPDRFTVTYPTRRGYRTQPFFAGYDGAPSLHSFTLSPYRNAGARFDSYDGRGYGYVFIIASNYPMATYSFSDDYDWVDLDVQDYFRTSDPRVAIRVFAERLTGGRSYTLKFARSYSTQNHSGYAAMAFDCAALSSVGLRYLDGFWDLYGPSWSAFGRPMGFNTFSYAGGLFSSGCGGRHYASYSRYAFGLPWNLPYNPYSSPRPVGTPPAGPITPVLTRPTERGFGERAGDLARSELTRSANTARNARDLANTVRTRNGSRNNDNGVSHRDLNRGLSDPMSSGGNRAASSGAAASHRDAASNARTYTPATSNGAASAARDAASTARVSAPPPPPSSGAAASAREAASAGRASTPPPPNPPPSNPQKQK
jgi:hypothetical protein